MPKSPREQNAILRVIKEEGDKPSDGFHPLVRSPGVAQIRTLAELKRKAGSDGPSPLAKMAKTEEGQGSSLTPSETAHFANS